MTINKHPDGKYNENFRDLVAKGRARMRARRNPSRSLLAIITALNTLNLKYCREISFWNPKHKGKQGLWDGGLQWVDFIVKPKGKRPFVIIHDDPMKRWKSYEKEAFKVKQQGLEDRNTPFLVLPKGMTSQEYQIKIAWFMRKVR